jgi:hypothetical protein
MTHRYLFVLAAALLAGCGSDSTGPSTTPPKLVASRVEILQGSGQVDTVGQQLPTAIRIQVLDTTPGPTGSRAEAAGGTPVPVPGQLVNFVVVSGGGHVFAGAALTDSIGRAQELWTLGPTAGAQCLEARAVDQETGEPLTFAQVCATGIPGPITAQGFAVDTLRVTGDSVVTLPVFAHDAFNNPIAVAGVAGIDSLGAQLVAGSWRATASVPGRQRFVLGSDTLTLMVHAPKGTYTWQATIGDTTWSVSGAYITSGVQSCDGASAPAMIYHATALWVIRSTAAVDTLSSGGVGTTVGGCSDLEDPRHIWMWLPTWGWMELALASRDGAGWHYTALQPGWTATPVSGTLVIAP